MGEDMFDGKISLSDWHQCAGGHQRCVFEHDLYPNILVKVLRIRGNSGERQSTRMLRFIDRFKRFGAYRTFRREVDEFIEQARKFTLSDTADLPIPGVLGFVQTEHGLGLVVEKITMANGQLAPTLRDLALAGRLTARHLAMIDELFERCRRLHIVLMDCNAGNFVVTDRRGFEELMCIDGTGEKSPLRIFALSRRANGFRLRQMREKLFLKLARTLNDPAALPNEGHVHTVLEPYLRPKRRLHAVEGVPDALNVSRAS
ncbi:hypothetical protein EKH55_1429 [Sinorhizobium alkalisoli]|nr:hypothetical protein EKH55_1429 [Sinorhizobium alkalisoli]